MARLAGARRACDEPVPPNASPIAHSVWYCVRNTHFANAARAGRLDISTQHAGRPDVRIHPLARVTCAGSLCHQAWGRTLQLRALGGLLVVPGELRHSQTGHFISL